jgi:prepilin peptidase CpaA
MDTLIINMTLASLLAAAVAVDTLTRRIPNKLTMPAAAAALLFHTIHGGAHGLWFSALGLLAGFGLMWLPFVLGGLGGGDLKLMAAVGALKGAMFALNTFLFAAIAGGIIALAVAASRGRLKMTFRNIRNILIGFALKTEIRRTTCQESGGDAFPYAAAIAAGAGAAAFLGPWLMNVR